MAWIHVPSQCAGSPSAPASAAWTSESPPPYPDTFRSVLWREKPIAPASWRRTWKRAPFFRHLSGTTSPPSTASHGVAAWISSMAPRRASHSRSRGGAQARPTSGTSGHILPVLSARSAQPSLFSRTCQGLCRSACTTCKKTYEQWVTTLRRVSLARQNAALRMYASDFSCLLPTPQVTFSNAIQQGGGNERNGKLRPGLEAMAMFNMWPTPTACSYGSNAHPGHVRPSLETLARQHPWPTPTVKGGHNKKGLSAKSGDGLDTWVKDNMWSTPTARHWKGAGPACYRRKSPCLSASVLQWPTPVASEATKGGPNQHHGTGTPTLTSAVAGSAPKAEGTAKLSPDWVELLMGMPKQWSAIPGPTAGKTARPAFTQGAKIASIVCERLAMR